VRITTDMGGEALPIRLPQCVDPGITLFFARCPVHITMTPIKTWLFGHHGTPFMSEIAVLPVQIAPPKLIQV
jgi:hypothetical protein